MVLGLAETGRAAPSAADAKAETAAKVEMEKSMLKMNAMTGPAVLSLKIIKECDGREWNVMRKGKGPNSRSGRMFYILTQLS